MCNQYYHTGVAQQLCAPVNAQPKGQCNPKTERPSDGQQRKLQEKAEQRQIFTRFELRPPRQLESMISAVNLPRSGSSKSTQQASRIASGWDSLGSCPDPAHAEEGVAAQPPSSHETRHKPQSGTNKPDKKNNNLRIAGNLTCCGYLLLPLLNNGEKEKDLYSCYSSLTPIVLDVATAFTMY
ncbi:hypothetical protein BST61_g6295 [Cercospora zeina]